MSDPISAIGLSASVLQLVCFTGSAIEKVARFAREASHVQETKGDLFATIINFNRSLQAVKFVLDTWKKKQIPGGMDTLEVGQILATANSVWKSCEEAVQRFEEKLESFGNRSRQNWLRDAMQQLKLRSRSAEMTRIKTRIDTEISTLQLLLACLKVFTLGDIHGKIENQLSAVAEKIRTLETRRISSYRKELRQHSQHSESNLSFSEFQNDTHLEVSSQRTRNPEWESSELKAMDECLNAAYSLVEKMSSLDEQTIRGGSAVMPYSSRVLQDGIFDAPSDTETDGGVRLQYSRQRFAENEIAAENIGSSSDYLLSSTGLPVEHVTTLIDEYLCSAAEDFDAGSYDGCKAKLNLAMNRGEARESQYGIPFDKRFQIKTKIAAVHAREESFGLAMTELTELRMQAESSNTRLEVTDEDLGELYYAIADLHFRRYKHDANLLKDLGESAEHAYGWAVRLPRLSSGSLLSRCVSILSEVYTLKGDDVAAKSLRQKHPISILTSPTLTSPTSISSPTLTDRPLGYRQPTSPNLTTPSSRTPSLESIPPTVFSTPVNRQHSGSISSSQTIPSTYDANKTLVVQVEEGNLKATELLLVIGCDTEQTDSQGRTPLLIAAKNKNLDIFLLLLNRADVRVRDDNGLTVLHHALRGFGGENIVGYILEKDVVDVNAVANDRKTPLHYCVDYDNTPAARMLLKNGGVDIEAQNSKKETAAIIAARRKNIEMIKLLHDCGAKFDRQRVPRGLHGVLDMFDEKKKSECQSNISRRSSQYAGSKYYESSFPNLSSQRQTQ